ncbi:uncharacterized protein UTRI_03469 [Ustilago trichophora]|uniref:Eukaryotic translation initiation factor 4E binding protein n=1 Tax=Ustilago trichophora TaxID=86804 RepID=A0A5C3E427_9BASI|nr:uncharacterized protein UTRI_03469 [Ustilago trichophora]
MSTQIPIRNTPTTTTTSSSSSVYATTPGGTPRIHYSRDQLLSLASSPLSRSPPGPPGFILPAAISKSPKLASSSQNRFNLSNPIPISNPNVVQLERRYSQDDDQVAFQMDL